MLMYANEDNHVNKDPHKSLIPYKQDFRVIPETWFISAQVIPRSNRLYSRGLLVKMRNTKQCNKNRRNKGFSLIFLFSFNFFSCLKSLFLVISLFAFHLNGIKTFL